MWSSRVGPDGARYCGSKAHTLESTSEELLNPQDDLGVQGHGHQLLHHQVRLDGVKCTREVHHEHPSVVTPSVQMLVQMVYQGKGGIVDTSICAICKLMWVQW